MKKRRIMKELEEVFKATKPSGQRHLPPLRQRNAYLTRRRLALYSFTTIWPTADSIFDLSNPLPSNMSIHIRRMQHQHGSPPIYFLNLASLPQVHTNCSSLASRRSTDASVFLPFVLPHTTSCQLLTSMCQYPVVISRYSTRLGALPLLLAVPASCRQLRSSSHCIADTSSSAFWRCTMASNRRTTHCIYLTSRRVCRASNPTGYQLRVPHLCLL